MNPFRFPIAATAIAAAVTLCAGTLRAQAPDFPALSIEMEYSTEKRGKPVAKESGAMRMTFEGARYGFTVAQGERGGDAAETTVVFDLDARTMTSVSDTDDGLVAVKMPLISLGDQDLPAFEGTVERTDETKTILGYDTRKYILRDGGDVTEAWLAEIPDFSWSDVATGMLGGRKANANRVMSYFEDMPRAFPLESHATTKGGKQVVHSYVRAVDLGGEADLSRLDIPAGAEVQDMTQVLRF